MQFCRSFSPAQLRLTAGTGRLSRRHYYQEVRTAIVVLYIPLARAAVAGIAGKAPVSAARYCRITDNTVASPLGLKSGSLMANHHLSI